MPYPILAAVFIPIMPPAPIFPLLPPPPKAAAIVAEYERDHILAAIVAVEGVANPRKPGKSGELTKYQFKPSVWNQYSHVPMKDASPAEIERVAIAHYKWCLAVMPVRNKELKLMPLAYRIALVWNAGYGNIVNNKVLPRHRDYAHRVQNLCP